MSNILYTDREERKENEKFDTRLNEREYNEDKYSPWNRVILIIVTISLFAFILGLLFTI